MALWTFRCWPMPPMLPFQAIEGLLIIAGIIFSVVMLIDCLKRRPERFPHPLTENAQHDRLIWAATIIIAALWVYFLGAIVYYFVVRKAAPKQQPPQQQQ